MKRIALLLSILFLLPLLVSAAEEHVFITISDDRTLLTCTTDLPTQRFDFNWYVNDHLVKIDPGVTHSTLPTGSLKQGDAIRCEAWFPGVSIRYGIATLVWQGGDRQLETVDLTLTPTSGEAPLTVSYTCHAAGGDEPLAYTIDFGDGHTSTDPSGTHVYAEPGVYTATCTVTDADGDTASDSVEVTVYTPVDTMPRVTLTATPREGDAPLTVSYQCTATGDEPLAYTIDFGDGHTSTAASGTHVYTAAGVYTMTCRVTDADGDTAQDALSITVREADVPLESLAFTIHPTSGEAPLTVSYDCAATGGNEPISYTVDFGDGHTSNDPSGTHVYAEPGVYTATCTAIDADGDTLTRMVNVTVREADENVQLILTVTPRNGTAPLSVNYTCSALTGNEPIAYHIDFGDGHTSRNPRGTHVYTTPGAYVLTCTATDADGDTASETASITVTRPDTLATAMLSVEPTHGEAPLSISGSCTIGGDAPLAYTIDFGDGRIIYGFTTSSSFTSTFTHTYTNPGSYTLTCSVTDADGDTATAVQAITVTPDSVPSITSFTITPDSGKAPLTVSYTCHAAGGDAPLRYELDFGDGHTSTDPSGTHVYAEPGVYTATCTVTDADGSTTSATHSVRVTEADVPITRVTFTITPDTGEVPLTVTYDCTATGGNEPISYTVDFGDGHTSSDPSGTHVYTEPGLYTASCTAVDADGDTASATQSVLVREADEAVRVAMRVEPRTGLAPLTITYDCIALSGNSPFTTLIDFGDSTSSTARSGTHVYTAAGVYTLTCTMTDMDGDTDSVSTTITVLEPATALLSVEPTSGSAPLTITARITSDHAEQVERITWDFGDGIHAEGAWERVHTYPREGVYTLCAVVHWVNGTSSILSQDITVHPAVELRRVDWTNVRVKHAFAWADAQGVHVTLSIENTAGEDAELRIQAIGLLTGAQHETTLIVEDGRVETWSILLPAREAFVKLSVQGEHVTWSTTIPPVTTT